MATSVSPAIQSLIDILKMANTGCSTIENAHQYYDDSIEAYIRKTIITTLYHKSKEFDNPKAFSDAYDSLYASEKASVEKLLAIEKLRTDAITAKVQARFPDMRSVFPDTKEYEQILSETPKDYKVLNIIALENEDVSSAEGVIGYYSPMIQDAYSAMLIVMNPVSFDWLNGDTHMLAHAGWWRNYSTKFWCNLVLFRTITFDSGHIIYTHVVTTSADMNLLFKKLETINTPEQRNSSVVLTLLSSSPSACYMPSPKFPLPQIPEKTISGIPPIAESPAFFNNCICPSALTP